MTGPADNLKSVFGDDINSIELLAPGASGRDIFHHAVFAHELVALTNPAEGP